VINVTAVHVKLSDKLITAAWLPVPNWVMDYGSTTCLSQCLD